MHGGGADYFQSLVEDTSRQHGIVYLAVSDTQGRILTHSNASRVGSTLHTTEGPKLLAPGNARQGHFAEAPDGGRV